VSLLGMKMVPNEAERAPEPTARKLPLVSAERARQPAGSRHAFLPSAVELEKEGLARALSALAGAETAEGRAWRGELLLWWGRFEQAQAEFEAARDAAPELEHPVLGLAGVAIAQRRWADALGLLEGRDAPSARCLAGEAYRNAGLLHDAQEGLKAGIAKYPGWVAAYLNLALIDAERGRRAHVTRAIARVNELAPGLLDDAARELGSKKGDSLGDSARVLQHALEMLRGNRNPEMVTWFTREGKLRARDSAANARGSDGESAAATAT
jgi:tetratricopeptide (TPR) repeat protein